MKTVLDEMGIRVFRIPREGAIEGLAYYCPEKDERHITMLGRYTSGNEHEYIFVLFHEIAHHRLGHMHMHTYPIWVEEYEADRWAFDRCVEVYGEGSWQVAELETKRKEHIRPILQGYIDYGLSHDVDAKIALWAGCDLTSKEAQAAMVPTGLWTHVYCECYADGELLPF